MLCLNFPYNQAEKKFIREVKFAIFFNLFFFLSQSYHRRKQAGGVSTNSRKYCLLLLENTPENQEPRPPAIHCYKMCSNDVF